MDEAKIARYNDWERKHTNRERAQFDPFERGPKSAYSRKEKYKPNYQEEN